MVLLSEEEQRSDREPTWYPAFRISGTKLAHSICRVANPQRRGQIYWRRRELQASHCFTTAQEWSRHAGNDHTLHFAGFVALLLWGCTWFTAGSCEEPLEGVSGRHGHHRAPAKQNRDSPDVDDLAASALASLPSGSPLTAICQWPRRCSWRPAQRRHGECFSKSFGDFLRAARRVRRLGRSPQPHSFAARPERTEHVAPHPRSGRPAMWSE